MTQRTNIGTPSACIPSDNLGHSASGSVAAFNTPILLTLPFEGITSATVASIGIPGFDFALGSVSFSPGPAPVPEAGSMLLVAGGMVGTVARRSLKSAAAKFKSALD